MLELHDVSAGYGRLPVLFDVTLTVKPGEVVALLGPNGAGKSTLLKTILGVVRTRSGEITWNGTRVTTARAADRVAMGISLCPEGRRVFPNLSVRENLLAGAFGRKAQATSAQLNVCTEIFPRLQERISQRAGSLSGGEQQMLAIARSLMSAPDLVLVDELSMGLAPLVVVELTHKLRELGDQGLSVIVVDQFAKTLNDCADRAYVLDKGRLEFDGSLTAASGVLEQAIGA
ncbi:MAG TPA: ABC transporter ATP-binding protein [Acidimicrobiia bacterium]|jgi:branched-chain amino acid transport system ATP-binding protein